MHWIRCQPDALGVKSKYFIVPVFVDSQLSGKKGIYGVYNINEL